MNAKKSFGSGSAGSSSGEQLMRGMHMNQTIRHVYIAGGLALFTGVVFFFAHNFTRRRRYRAFYKDYDADEAYKNMESGGILSSAPKDPPPAPPPAKK